MTHIHSHSHKFRLTKLTKCAYTHIQIAQWPTKHVCLHTSPHPQRHTHTSHQRSCGAKWDRSGITPFVVPHKAACSVIIWESLSSALQPRWPGHSPLLPLVTPLSPHSLPPPPLLFLGKAPPFVLATKIRKKWDICKANEAHMAGSYTPSKAEANCVLSTQSKWMGERQRETFEVNDGMGYLLRKSGGHRAHMQLLMRVVTVAVWSLERNNRFQCECLDRCRNTMWRPAETPSCIWTINTLIPITIKQALVGSNRDVGHLRICPLK